MKVMLFTYGKLLLIVSFSLIGLHAQTNDKKISKVGCGGIEAFISSPHNVDFIFSFKKEEKIISVPSMYSFDPVAKKVRNQQGYYARATIMGHSYIYNNPGKSWFDSSIEVPYGDGRELGVQMDSNYLWKPFEGATRSHYKNQVGYAAIYSITFDPDLTKANNNYWYKNEIDTNGNLIPAHYITDADIKFLPIHACYNNRIKTTLEIPDAQGKLNPTEVWISKFNLCANINGCRVK